MRKLSYLGQLCAKCPLALAPRGGTPSWRYAYEEGRSLELPSDPLELLYQSTHLLEYTLLHRCVLLVDGAHSR